MARIVALLLAIVAVSCVSAVDVAQSCRTGEVANFDDVVVTIGGVVCTESPCPLVRGTTAECAITFTTKNEVSALIQKINATVIGTGVTVGFPVPDADKGCDKLDGSYCPLDSGESATINLAFEVLKIYPKVPLDLAIFLHNQNNEEVTCFRMLGNVVDA